MAWSPGLIESQSNGDRFAISKGSFTKKSQSYSSWTEDEGNKEVRSKLFVQLKSQFHLFTCPGLGQGGRTDSGRQDQRDHFAGEETGLHSNAIVHRVDAEA